MKRKWKIAGLVAFFILISAAGIFVALPFFAAQKSQPEESILSLSETLRGQRDELERLEKRKKEIPQDKKSVDAIVGQEVEIKQAMRQTVSVYREKLREEIKHFHELEAQRKRLAQNDKERKLHQEWIDALGQNQANIIFWLQRSVREAPRCYCVPSDVWIFLSGR